MNDMITVRGFVATQPILRETHHQVHVTDFRLASSSRRYDVEKGEWVDTGATNWYTVNCFRYMADNVASSLRVGDPVLVQGRLKIRDWADESGRKGRNVEIEASALGPDLAMGRADYRRAGASRTDNTQRHPNDDAQDHTPHHDATTGEILEERANAMTGGIHHDSPMVGGTGAGEGQEASPGRDAVGQGALDRESEAEISSRDMDPKLRSELDAALNPNRNLNKLTRNTAGV